MKLDTLRPFGRVVGRPAVCPGACYTQDGNFFDAEKQLIQPEECSHAGKNDERQERPNVQVNDDGEGQEKNDAEEIDEEVVSSLSESQSVSILEPILEPVSEPYMSLSDEELDTLAATGMGPLREYAKMFGVKGVAKKQLINGLKALRT